jgi:MFS transporter, DHA1 family, inner membrane transport protein
MNKQLITLALGNFAVGTGALVLAGVLPAIAQDFAVSPATAGYTVTVYALTYAVTAPVLGALLGRLPRQQLLLIALGLVTGFSLLAAVANSFGMLLLARALAAVGGGLYSPTAAAVGTTLVPPEERGRALALVFAGLPLATILGVPIGTLIGDRFGWHATFVLVAALGLLAFALVSLLVGQVTNPTPTSLRVLRTVLTDRGLLLAISVQTLQVTGQFIVFTYIALSLRTISGLEGSAISGILFLIGLAGFVGNWLGGYSGDRWGVRVTIITNLIILLLTLAAVPLTTTLPITILVMVVWGIVGFGFNPAQQKRLVLLAPTAAGAMLALNAAALYVGNALGALVGGIVLENIGIVALGPVAAVVVGLALATFLLSVRQQTDATPAAQTASPP